MFSRGMGVDYAPRTKDADRAATRRGALTGLLHRLGGLCMRLQFLFRHRFH